MKHILLTIFAAATVCLLPVATRAAEQSDYMDRICPEATAPVREWNVITKDPKTPLVTGIELAQKLIAVYIKCADEKRRFSGAPSGNYRLSVTDNTGAELAHYAQLRASQYEFSLGKLQAALQHYDEAREAFKQVIKLTNDTIEWRAPSLGSYSSNSATVGSGSWHDPKSGVSDYRGPAIIIRDRALAELEKLPKEDELPTITSGGGGTK